MGKRFEGSGMALRLVEALCEPASSVNEDAWGCSRSAVWVLDGATGVAPRPHLSATTDAAWFAQQMSLRLAEALVDPTPTLEAVTCGVRALAEVAARLCDLQRIPHFELPSASLVAAREVEDRLELTSLGDCVAVWRPTGSGARRFGEARELAALEAGLHRKLDEALAAGLSRQDGLARAAAQARENRKLMNRPGGYPILDLYGDGLAGAQVEVCPEPGPLDVLLMSDGFSRLVEVYAAYDWDGLLDRAMTHGLAGLYEQLRCIEAADEDCRRHQRFKPRDDATAVLLRWKV